MDVNEEALVGEPLEEVPEQSPTDEACMGRRSEKRDGESVFVGYCGAWPGKGTDHVGEGRCSKHGGAGGAPEGNDNAEGNDGGAAPEGNTNAVTHGAYADENTFYQDVLGDDLRDLVDDIFEDYTDRYADRHGETVPVGLEMELFRLSVSHVKDVVLDRWATQKPESLQSGNPLVDRETERDFNPEDGSVVVEQYKESVVLTAQKRLSSDRRQWLKDLGLLEDPDSQLADSQQDVADALREVLK